MGRVASRSKLSVEDYLVWERAQLEKHEFFDGEVFAMAGASPRHNHLCARVISALVVGLPATCSVMTSDQRLRARENRYVYADIAVVCGGHAIEHGDVVTNPVIVVEVLSQSTEQYDRGLKWDGYQSIASLTDYVLVSQDRAHIEHFSRAPGRRWTYTTASAGQTITLSNGLVLDVDKLFAGAFDIKGDETPPTA